MISLLRGTVLSIYGNLVTLDVQGVGYEIAATAAALARLEVGATTSVIIYTDVREDAIRLYGFADAEEKQVFSLLLKVSGIGTKTAADIISKIDKFELLRAIAHGDTARLQQVKGIGKKSAERIVLELQDKVGEYAVAGAPSVQRHVSATPLQAAYQDAIAAMVALGFVRKEAERAVGQVQSNGAKLAEAGEIVREALRVI